MAFDAPRRAPVPAEIDKPIDKLNLTRDELKQLKQDVKGEMESKTSKELFEAFQARLTEARETSIQRRERPDGDHMKREEYVTLPEAAQKEVKYYRAKEKGPKIFLHDTVDVLFLQATLRKLGFKGENGRALTIDGAWGDNTKGALIAFQQAAKTENFYTKKVDGEFGPESLDALAKYIAKYPAGAPEAARPAAAAAPARAARPAAGRDTVPHDLRPYRDPPRPAPPATAPEAAAPASPAPAAGAARPAETPEPFGPPLPPERLEPAPAKGPAEVREDFLRDDLFGFPEYFKNRVEAMPSAATGFGYKASDGHLYEIAGVDDSRRAGFVGTVKKDGRDVRFRVSIHDASQYKQEADGESKLDKELKKRRATVEGKLNEKTAPEEAAISPEARRQREEKFAKSLDEYEKKAWDAIKATPNFYDRLEISADNRLYLVDNTEKFEIFVGGNEAIKIGVTYHNSTDPAYYSFTVLSEEIDTSSGHIDDTYVNGAISTAKEKGKKMRESQKSALMVAATPGQVESLPTGTAIEVKTDNISALLKSKKTTIFILTAPSWCGPCKGLEASLPRLMSSIGDRAHVATLRSDKHPQTGEIRGDINTDYDELKEALRVEGSIIPLILIKKPSGEITVLNLGYYGPATDTKILKAIEEA